MRFFVGKILKKISIMNFSRPVIGFLFSLCLIVAITNPVHVSAAITAADRDAIIFSALDPITVPSNGGFTSWITGQGGEPSSQVVAAAERKLKDIAQESFDLLKNNSTTTAADLRVKTYTVYGNFLSDVISGSVQLRPGSSGLVSTDRSYIQLLKTNVGRALGLAINTTRVEAGTLAAADKPAADRQVQDLQNAEMSAIVKGLTDPKPVCDINPVSEGSFSLGACIDEGAAWLITHTLLAIAGWFLWITATVMNFAIKVGILDFAKWAPGTLYPIWMVIRQIVSLFVVFAGLWLGFMYIINKGDQFKKYIPTLVLFALFVNFSYPITRAIIDVSNVISLNMYASAVGVEALEASAVSVTSDKTVGTIIMNRLGLEGFIDYATGNSTGEGKLNSINSTPAALLAVIFILYAAWIFFMVSALIITRTAVLVFLIVASPLLFVDEIIPKLGDAAKKLRGIFVEMLFVGPVFTIMLALTLKFLEVFQKGGLLSNSGPASQGGDAAIAMSFNLLMMLIMLHIMLKVTKATSGEIGKVVSGATSMVGGLAVGGAFGGMAMAGRATLGRAAAAARDSKWMQRSQGGAMGRHMFNLSDTFAKSSFDGRNSAVAKFGASKLGTNFGMGGTKGREELITEHRTKLETHLGRTGVHKSNVYDASGKLLHEKGSIDTSPDALMSRQRVINGSKSVFSSAQVNNDMGHQLNEANKKQVVAEQEKALTDISKLNTDTDRTKIDDLFEKYQSDLKMTKKLKDAFAKKMSDEFATLDGDAAKKEAFILRLSTATPGTPSGAIENEAAGKLVNMDNQKALTEYKNQATDIAKTRYKSIQTTEAQNAITEFENKKLAEEVRRDAAANASLAATNAVAVEQARTTQATVDLLAHFTAPHP